MNQEHVSEQEQKTGRTYRVLLIAFIAVVAGLSIWIALPPRSLDLRFLAPLHPKVTESNVTYKSLEFKQTMAAVEKAIDERLTKADGWTKDSTSSSGAGGVPGYVAYRHPGRGVPNLMLSPTYDYAAVGPPKAGTTPSPKIVGCHLDITDPRDVAKLP